MDKKSTASISNEKPSSLDGEAVREHLKAVGRTWGRSFLMSLLVTEALVFLWLLPHDPATLSRLRSLLPNPSPSATSSSRNPFTANMKFDPRLGTALLPKGVGKLVRQVAPRNVPYTLLGYVGAAHPALMWT